MDYDIWMNIHALKEKILMNVKLWFDIDDDDYIISTNPMGISWNPYRSDNSLDIVTTYSIEIDIHGHIQFKDRFGKNSKNAKGILKWTQRN